MRIPAALAALALPFALVPAIAFAADEPVAADGTSLQDIQCAAWAAYVVGTSDDPEITTAFGYAMTFFIGMYEGKTGQHFTEAMLVEAEKVETDEVLREAIESVCLPRMQVMGERLADFG